MNCNELKEMLSEKDDEVKSKRDFSIEIFNKIKNDCLESIQKEAVERNFDGEFCLHDNAIMKAISKALNLNFDGVYFDSSWVHGVESQRITICYRTSIHHFMLLDECMKLRFMASQNSNDSERNELIKKANDYKDKYCRIREKEGDIKDLIKKIDYPMLCMMLRSYIISNGFHGVTKVHRYTDKKCKLLRFTTTRSKLLRSACCSSNRDNDSNEKLIGASIIAITVIFAIIFFALS